MYILYKLLYTYSPKNYLHCTVMLNETNNEKYETYFHLKVTITVHNSPNIKKCISIKCKACMYILFEHICKIT